jgi:hypothetical protein
LRCHGRRQAQRGACEQHRLECISVHDVLVNPVRGRARVHAVRRSVASGWALASMSRIFASMSRVAPGEGRRGCGRSRSKTRCSRGAPAAERDIPDVGAIAAPPARLGPAHTGARAATAGYRTTESALLAHLQRRRPLQRCERRLHFAHFAGRHDPRPALEHLAVLETMPPRLARSTSLSAASRGGAFRAPMSAIPTAASIRARSGFKSATRSGPEAGRRARRGPSASRARPCGW